MMQDNEINNQVNRVLPGISSVWSENVDKINLAWNPGIIHVNGCLYFYAFKVFYKDDYTTFINRINSKK